jgi:hypothetical protein
MTIYFIKEDNYLYKFGTFHSLENYTGKCRKLMKATLAQSIRQFFPHAEMCASNGAFLKGWIDLNGNPVPSLSKGNSYN